jgi:hypothetical protein
MDASILVVALVAYMLGFVCAAVMLSLFHVNPADQD